MSVRKRYSNNLLIDFDYSFSHSIDNQSNITNRYEPVYVQRARIDLRPDEPADVPGGLAVRCAAHHHANYVYDLPVGRGQRFLSSTSTLVNTLVVVATSGILSYRTDSRSRRTPRPSDQLHAGCAGGLQR